MAIFYDNVRNVARSGDYLIIDCVDQYGHANIVCFPKSTIEMIQDLNPQQEPKMELETVHSVYATSIDGKLIIDGRMADGIARRIVLPGDASEKLRPWIGPKPGAKETSPTKGIRVLIYNSEGGRSWRNYPTAKRIGKSGRDIMLRDREGYIIAEFPEGTYFGIER